jgi:hypothetical protein
MLATVKKWLRQFYLAWKIDLVNQMMSDNNQCFRVVTG